jgi:hypothetical protein
MHHSSYRKAATIDQLTDPGFLAGLFGPFRNMSIQPLTTPGYSGSVHKKIMLEFEDGRSISLILKHVYPAQDMTIWRSGNIGNREAMLLDDPGMAAIWKIFQTPCIAYAIEHDNSALLMQDVSAYLFPDVREPVSLEQEDIMLKHLARMHAYYWEHELLSRSWLTDQDKLFSFLGPFAVEEEQARGRTHPIFEHVQHGWKLALQLLPADARKFILDPPIEKLTAGLPKTLIHGDTKLANFAIMPGEQVAAFDWTITAAASPACEMGWYIAVNASRLARPKEQVLNRYRELLQTELHFSIPEAKWKQMTGLAVLTGAALLLWNKALNFNKHVAGAEEEWNWWVDNIKKIYGNR